MTTRRIFITLAIIVTLAGAASSVSRARSKFTSSSTSLVALVLFDVSRSTGNAAIRREYLNDFEMVLTYVAARGGLVFGDLIDSAPLSRPSLPIRVSFPSPGLLTNPLNNNPQALIAAAMRAAGMLLNLRERKPGTAILDALTLSSNVFANYPGSATKHYLVILSDGIEESPRYRFTNRTLSQAAIKRFITEQRVAQVLPNLSRAAVYFAGAGTTAESSLSSVKAWKIRNFWLTYFNATGAQLSASHYGPSLVRFP